MQVNPIQEWQRLAEHYRQVSDGELRELACDFADLTPTAQQALHSEMQSRGLGDPQAPEASPPANAPRTPANAHIETMTDLGIALGPIGRTPDLVPDTPDGAGEEGPHEYTWKTVLCDCETNEEAQQLSETLRQSGIESWVQRAIEFGRRDARILVAADQLDQARVIAAQPIPAEIVEQAKAPVSEFVAPHCPWCGAEDPILEAVEEGNCWLCEACGAEWRDSGLASEQLEEL